MRRGCSISQAQAAVAPSTRCPWAIRLYRGVALRAEEMRVRMQQHWQCQPAQATHWQQFPWAPLAAALLRLLPRHDAACGWRGSACNRGAR